MLIILIISFNKNNIIHIKRLGSIGNIERGKGQDRASIYCCVQQVKRFLEKCARIRDKFASFQQISARSRAIVRRFRCTQSRAK